MTWTNEDATRLGDTLRALRKQRGLTQEGLAYPAGLTKNSLQLLEAGRGSGRKDSTSPSNPRMATLTSLAGALGMSVSQLLSKADL
ncbi:helix-turn-helix domain-containing protein [Brachybacterium sp. UNK5269]|uniref:helix-turn-helix domain-containing protein n=1 Tax=Brachybacterium sp. UNK5269 TaxID=3408576 RepID=UPI003BAE838C